MPPDNDTFPLFIHSIVDSLLRFSPRKTAVQLKIARQWFAFISYWRRACYSAFRLTIMPPAIFIILYVWQRWQLGQTAMQSFAWAEGELCGSFKCLLRQELKCLKMSEIRVSGWWWWWGIWQRNGKSNRRLAMFWWLWVGTVNLGGRKFL